MANDDIDLDRVLVDPAYRREVIEYLKAVAQSEATLPRRALADQRIPAEVARPLNG